MEVGIETNSAASPGRARIPMGESLMHLVQEVLGIEKQQRVRLESGHC